MKKEIVLHLVPFVVVFALLTLIHRWFEVNVILFWLGGLLGTLLPDMDHLVYIYFSHPQELTSQRTASLINQKKLSTSLDLLYRTREERAKLIFHTLFFQLIFFVLAFFVVTSTGSLFGGGLVIAFLVHLLVDQYGDLKEKGTLDNWMADTKLSFTKERLTFLWVTMWVVTFLFGWFISAG